MKKEPRTLIIIDMQQGMSSPSAGPRNNPNAEQNIARLLTAWRKVAAPLIHVRHISRTVGSPFWPGQPGVEFQKSLVPLRSEHVVEKNVPDAFINTGLELGFASGTFGNWQLLESARITRSKRLPAPQEILALIFASFRTQPLHFQWSITRAEIGPRMKCTPYHLQTSMASTQA